MVCTAETAATVPAAAAVSDSFANLMTANLIQPWLPLPRHILNL